MAQVIGKFIVIALVAGTLAWLPVSVLSLAQGFSGGFWSDVPSARWEVQGLLFSFAMLGSYGVGFPVALAVYFLAKRQLVGFPSTVFVIGLLSGVVLMLASFVIGGGFGMLVLGLPSVIAAMTFALMGWFWILKPMDGERPAGDRHSA